MEAFHRWGVIFVAMGLFSLSLLGTALASPRAGCCCETIDRVWFPILLMGCLILGGQVGCPRLVDGPSCRVPCVVANPAEAGVRVAKFATS